MTALLAQTHVSHDGGGALTLSIIALIGMSIPFFVLAWVCWIFLKAKRREDEELRRKAEWRGARSS